jgi:hypothetical protein
VNIGAGELWHGVAKILAMRLERIIQGKGERESVMKVARRGQWFHVKLQMQMSSEKVSKR